MCGIAGYVGREKAINEIFDMLSALEYRGYDSAGIAYLEEGLTLVKDRGKVAELRERSKPKQGPRLAIGHSRWATHGPPSQQNAHPHADAERRIAIVHNGIIENYSEIRDELKKKGYAFSSDTDSETIVHLIADELKSEESFEDAFQKALRRLEGSFAILALYAEEKEKVFFARNESPLLIGIGKGENFIASDMPAFLKVTNKAIIIDDMEYGFVTKEHYVVKEIRTKKKVKKKIHLSDMDLSAAEKQGHEHFMLKEILEESVSVKNALRSLDIVRLSAKKIDPSGKVYFVGCGTAWHAGVTAKYILQEYGLSAFSEVASEFRYSNVNSIGPKDTVVLISQSGETADTLAAAKSAKKRGAGTIAVVNVVGSSLTRIADNSIYTYSGPEIAVASTKVYLGQLTVLSLLALEILALRGKLAKDELERIRLELKNLPAKIDEILDAREQIAEVARILENTNDYFYIARRQNYPTAMEGALKLKEISYLHAEAYPGGELKHGPLALMEEKVCVIAIKPSDELEKKMDSNIEEIRARGAKIIQVVESEAFSISNGGDIKINVPRTEKVFSPILSVVPLHLLAYYVALSKGHDIDKPRNLAKSVTVE